VVHLIGTILGESPPERELGDAETECPSAADSALGKQNGVTQWILSRSRVYKHGESGDAKA
jgi:hypothetical protein